MSTKKKPNPDDQPENGVEGEEGESETPGAGDKNEFEITLGMGADGNPITKKLTLDELKKGYMRTEDYTQKTQTLADEKKRLLASYDNEEDLDEEDRDEGTQGQPSQQQFQLSPEAREALRQEMLSILGSPEGRKFVEQVAEEKVSTREGLSKLENELTRLEKELDGSDGRPKFVREEILAHGKLRNNYDPFSVYWDLHRPQLIEWETQQALKKQGKVVKTERSTGYTPPPPKGKLSDDTKKATLEYFKQVAEASSE